MTSKHVTRVLVCILPYGSAIQTIFEDVLEIKTLRFGSSKVRNPNEDLIETLYQKLAGPLRKTIEDANPDLIKALNTQESEIKILENDVLVSGTSVRNIAQLQASWQIQVEQYFGLLQSVTGEPITESFEEITEEFPENAIKEIIAQIDKAIRPNYQDTKKNSELH